jgi:hypothetical protein
MPGFKMRKVFCQGFTRAGLRKGLKIPCKMKGYLLANNVYKCKYHGYQNVKGFKKENYTDETRIKQLSKLIQFKNYTDDKLKEYYYQKIKPRIDNNQPSRYNMRQTSKWKNPYRNSGGSKGISVQLDEVLCVLKKKSRIRNKNNGS